MTALDDLRTLRDYTRKRYATRGRRYGSWGDAHRARLIDKGLYIRTSEQRPNIGLFQFLTRLPEPYSPHTEKGRRRWDRMNKAHCHNPSETTP